MSTPEPIEALPLAERPRLERLSVRACGAIGLVVGLSAAALGGFGAFGLDTPLPSTIAFELLILLAAVFGVLLAFGRFMHGPAIAMVCIAGVFGGAGLLAFLDLRANVLAGSTWRSIAEVCFVVRALSAVGLLLLAAGAVLSRTKRGSRLAGIGVLVLVPTLGVVAAVALTTPAWLLQPAEGAAEAVRVSALLLGAIFAGVVASVGGALVIRGLQLGSDKRLLPSSAAA